MLQQWRQDMIKLQVDVQYLFLATVSIVYTMYNFFIITWAHVDQFSHFFTEAFLKKFYMYLFLKMSTSP